MIAARFMRFIETSLFTKRIVRIVDDDAYRKLQLELAANPEKGRLIQGTGGLRSGWQRGAKASRVERG